MLSSVTIMEDSYFHVLNPNDTTCLLVPPTSLNYPQPGPSWITTPRDIPTHDDTFFPPSSTPSLVPCIALPHTPATLSSTSSLTPLQSTP